MAGTLSRIPRGNNLVTSQLEALGVAVADQETTSLESSGTRSVVTAAITTRNTSSSVRRATRQFSPELLLELRSALQRGDVTLHDLHSALSGATLTNEDDIRRVLDVTIRLKHAINAMGMDAHQLLKRVHPDTVAYLLRRWVAEPPSTPN